jgi:D-lactate dehydrogenase (cytochrome)
MCTRLFAHSSSVSCGKKDHGSEVYWAGLDVKHATEAAVAVLNTGVGIREFPISISRLPPQHNNTFPIECVELCDDILMRATNKYGISQRTYPEKDSLFFKLQGHSHDSLQDAARVVHTVVERHGGTGFQLVRSEKEAEDLWMDRKNALYSALALVCVVN